MHADEAQQQSIAGAHAAGALVNRADVDEDSPSDFATPAQLLLGSVTIAISAGGSPALAAMIRDELATRLDPNRIAMADAMQQLRPMLRSATTLTPVRRRGAFRDLATTEACNLLANAGMDALLQWLRHRYPEL